ncbi:MAG: flagellar hook-associated protein FlgK, partial [Betaproteobacteria bacterium]|nr:flagellar hook-associated protein FlgK [Betaproteobacteria bacterium]
ALVVGSTTQDLTAGGDPADASSIVVGAGAGAAARVFRAGEIVGGELGGLLAFRDEALSEAQNSIGRLALAVAGDVNAQHRLGQDLNGAPGQDLFAVGTPRVGAASTNTGSANLSAAVVDTSALAASDYNVLYDGADFIVTRLSDNTQNTYASLPQTFDGITVSQSGTPAAGDSFLVQATRGAATSIAVTLANANQIAAALPVRVEVATANMGDAGASGLVVQSLDPNLLAPVTITFTGAASFDVSGAGTGSPGGLAYVPGAAIAFNGWSLAIQGTPRAGDRFTVTPNAGGVGDNGNALRLGGLATATRVQGASYTNGYAQLVSGIGARERAVDLTSRAQDLMLEQANQSLASVSGVNLDEEAANLLRYQQAYQASSKVITVANSLFDEILTLFR